MTQLFRYRQLSIVRRANTTPQVQGIEEVSINGHRQIRYFGNEVWKTARGRGSLKGVQFLPFNESLDRVVLRSFPFDEYVPRDPMSRDSREIVLDERQLRSAQPSPLQDLQQSIGYCFDKVRRVIVKLPQAVKAAWKELA